MSEIKNSYYNDENLVYSVMNLFAAGTDTTGNTLQWFLVFMAKYPHIQGAKTHLSTYLKKGGGGVDEHHIFIGLISYFMRVQIKSRRS